MKECPNCNKKTVKVVPLVERDTGNVAYYEDFCSECGYERLVAPNGIIFKIKMVGSTFRTGVLVDKEKL